MVFTTDAEFLAAADLKGREAMRRRLVEKHGELRETVIARSILSRPIEAYFVGDGNRYILLAATHHALESITANFAYAFIDYLLSRYERGSILGVDCKLLLSKYCFLVIPCVNPDGVELRYNGVSDSPIRDRIMRMSGGDFSAWQANVRGVDLNHNYAEGFYEYKRIERERGIEAGATLYSGEAPESEPESRGVANLVRTVMPRAIVALHTQGEEIYSYPRTARVLRYADRLGSATGYRPCNASGTAAYGGLSNYSATLGIPSFTIEMGRGENPLDESLLPSIFRRCADALAILPTIL